MVAKTRAIGDKRFDSFLLSLARCPGWDCGFDSRLPNELFLDQSHVRPKPVRGMVKTSRFGLEGTGL